MKNRALKKCKDEQKAYADCVRGRGISLARARRSLLRRLRSRASRRAVRRPQVWVCRESANAMGACLTCVARRIAALRAGADTAAAPPLARRGHTDAAALEALKQRWVKAGKPNLSDKCVALRPMPRKTRLAAASCCLLRSLTRVSPRCPAQPGLLSARRVQKRAWCDHTLASHNTKTSRRLRHAL